MVRGREPAGLALEELHRRQERHRAERQRGEDREDEDRAAAHERRLVAIDVVLVDHVGGDDLQERHRGGQGRERDQHVEERPEQVPEGHLGEEELRQRDEEHADGRAADLLGHAGHREDHREHDDRRDERDERVEQHDHGRRLHDRLVALQVGAVRHHRAHAEREREEGVAERLQDAPGLQPAEVRPEDEAERLAAAAHAQRADEHEDQDAEEDREEEPRDALDALLDAEVDDGDRADAEGEGEAELEPGVGDLRVEDGPGLRPRREAPEHPLRGPREVVERPARDHRVVAEQDEAAQHAPHPDDAPRGSDRLLERAHHALLRRAPDQDLGHHDRQADGGDAHQVDQHERAAVVLPGDEGELPQVAEADGAPGGREDEADARAPVAALL